MADLKVPYLRFRDGRPRWEPGPGARKLGFRGQDLKDAGGAWLGRGAAIEAAERLNKRLTEAKAAGGAKARRQAAPRTLTALWQLYAANELPGLKPSTAADYRRKVRPVLDVLGKRQVAELGKPDCYRLAKRLEAEHGAGMAAAIVAVLRAVLSHAELVGWRPANSNPAFGLKLKAPAPRTVVWSSAELQAFVAAADQAGLPSVGDAVLLAAHTGQRCGDCLAATWSDLQDGRLLLKQAKTGVPVDLRLTPQLQARLDAARRRPHLVRLDGPLVAAEHDGRAWNASTFRNAFGKVRDLAAESCASIADKRFQDLRDTAVTRLAIAGCSKWEIAAITGHSFGSIDRVLAHYLVLGRELADAAIDKLETWIAQEGIAI